MTADRTIGGVGVRRVVVLTAAAAISVSFAALFDLLGRRYSPRPAGSPAASRKRAAVTLQMWGSVTPHPRQAGGRSIWRLLV